MRRTPRFGPCGIQPGLHPGGRNGDRPTTDRRCRIPSTSRPSSFSLWPSSWSGGCARCSGQKTGSEQPPLDPFSRREAPPPPATAPPTPEATTSCGCPAPRTAPAAADGRSRGRPLEGLRRARHADRRAASTRSPAPSRASMPRGFIEGAKAAYEMIVTAFAQGDRKTLKDLLSREVYDGFERAITEREQARREGRDHLRLDRQGRDRRRRGPEPRRAGHGRASSRSSSP